MIGNDFQESENNSKSYSPSNSKSEEKSENFSYLESENNSSPIINDQWKKIFDFLEENEVSIIKPTQKIDDFFEKKRKEVFNSHKKKSSLIINSPNISRTSKKGFTAILAINVDKN